MADYVLNNYTDLQKKDTLDETGLAPLDPSAEPLLNSNRALAEKVEVPVTRSALNYQHIFQALAEIGKQLAETYSEENQETSEGFVAALDLISELENQLISDAASLTAVEKDGFMQLLAYLRGKLERRAKAADANVVNM